MLKKISIYLVGLIPLSLVAGPFIAELVLFMILLSFLYYLFKEKQFLLINNNIFKIFLLFWLYIVAISFFSSEQYISIKSSLPYVRFGLYTLAIVYFLRSYEKSIETIYLLFKLTLLFVILDSIFQIFFGFDIFGIKTGNADLMRISGPFGDKFILGSFIQKILPVFIYLVLKSYKKNNEIKLLDFIIIIFSFVMIYRSGDRSAFGLILLYSFIFFLTNHSFRKRMIYIFISVVLISTIFTFQNPKIFNRHVVDTIGQFKGKYYENFFNDEVNETKLNFMIFSFHHQTHFSTAFRMFLDKPIFGHGLKMFRYKCEKFSFKPKKNVENSFGEVKHSYGCSTHPHNTYLQLLAESGVIGFFFIFSLFVILFFKIINLFKISKKKIYPENALLIGIFVNLWPLIPTGNFFNNWISIIYFVPVAYYVYEKYNKLEIKIDK
ncbi:O-antigen ligase family protein [Candidatus Pelagibacter sp.]|nr:O-antigen ligase family protein [Candidatus Pelagibacter sp.]